MSFVLFAIPLASFGAGYLYGSYGTNTYPKAPPLPPTMIEDIQKGIPLKHVEFVENNKVVWSSHDHFLRQIHSHPQLKKTEIQERVAKEDPLMKDLKEKLLKKFNQVEKL